MPDSAEPLFPRWLLGTVFTSLAITCALWVIGASFTWSVVGVVVVLGAAGSLAREMAASSQ